MKNAAMAAAMVLSMAWVWAAAVGQSAASKPDLPTGFVSLPGGGWGSYEDLFKVCELGKEQLQKVSDIQAKRKTDCQEAEKAYQKAQEAYRRAVEAKDTGLMEALQADIDRACTALRESVVRAEAGTMAVLTPEQQVRWRQYVALKEVKARYAKVKLTDEQWDKITDACEKLAKNPDLKLGGLYEKVNALLTAEQKAAWILSNESLAKMDKVCRFTPEQVAELVPIEGARCKAEAELLAQKSVLYKAEREALAAGDRNIVTVQPLWQDWHRRNNAAKAQFEDKVHSVLTAEQRAKWKEAAEAHSPAGAK